MDRNNVLHPEYIKLHAGGYRHRWTSTPESPDLETCEGGVWKLLHSYQFDAMMEAYEEKLARSSNDPDRVQ